MGNTNHQNAIIRDIVETLGLNENECVEKDGAIIIARQGGKEELEIRRDVSVLLKRHNNVRFKFINCIFEEPIALQQITFGDILYFLNSSFEREVDFSTSLFKERVFFSESIFKDNVSFSEVIFDNNAYFDGAKFLGEADFSLSEFRENAHFYGTHFNEFPNFIQAIFSENVNFTNTELDFGFDEVKNEIEKTYNKRKEEYDREQGRGDKEEPKKHKIANEFRDSFRNIKSSLIEHHNMLDASKYHRVELYCKELEMEYRNSGLRDFVDKIQLYYYRITSDHHTNLLLILTNVLALIVFFGGVATTLFCCANDLPKKIKVGRECCEPEQGYHLFTTFPEHIIDYIFPPNLAVWGEVLAIIILCITFVYVFISIVRFIHRIKSERLHCWFRLLCVPTLIILAIKPAIMLPIFGKLIDEKLKVDFPAFTSLSVVYAVLMFLLVWSLQKTARKNTIVPN